MASDLLSIWWMFAGLVVLRPSQRMGARRAALLMGEAGLFEHRAAISLKAVTSLLARIASALRQKSEKFRWVQYLKLPNSHYSQTFAPFWEIFLSGRNKDGELSDSCPSCDSGCWYHGLSIPEEKTIATPMMVVSEEAKPWRWKWLQ
jgi:hypothetical protein